jgi:hypothetical protein
MACRRPTKSLQKFVRLYWATDRPDYVAESPTAEDGSFSGPYWLVARLFGRLEFVFCRKAGVESTVTEESRRGVVSYGLLPWQVVGYNARSHAVPAFARPTNDAQNRVA